MRRKLRIIFIVLGICIVLDCLWLLVTWPDFDALKKGSIPRSAFIEDYLDDQKDNSRLPRLQWSPVAISQIPKHVMRAVIVAEDSNFYSHEGVDWEAIGDAVDHNLEKGKFSRGGSTITQQTVKNLYLSDIRSPIRKWHEMILTYAIEQKLSKTRILTIYLNIAEFGLGVYGVEAAARRYWHTSASALSFEQAAELAASLPSPKKNNPATRTRSFMKRRDRILRVLNKVMVQH